MASDPFTNLLQGVAGCDERFFQPAQERMRAAPLVTIKRPDGGEEFYVNVKISRSKLLRMEANKSRRRRCCSKR